MTDKTSKGPGKEPKPTPAAGKTDRKGSEKLTDEELGKVSGGLNPQPLPPGYRV